MLAKASRKTCPDTSDATSPMLCLLPRHGTFLPQQGQKSVLEGAKLCLRQAQIVTPHKEESSLLVAKKSWTAS